MRLPGRTVVDPAAHQDVHGCAVVKQHDVDGCIFAAPATGLPLEPGATITEVPRHTFGDFKRPAVSENADSACLQIRHDKRHHRRAFRRRRHAGALRRRRRPWRRRGGRGRWIGHRQRRHERVGGRPRSGGARLTRAHPPVVRAVQLQLHIDRDLRRRGLLSGREHKHHTPKRGVVCHMEFVADLARWTCTRRVPRAEGGLSR